MNIHTSSNFIISGIKPGLSGTGRVMNELERHKSKYNVEICYFENNISDIEMIRQSNIILIHPQTIGYDLFIKLINQNRKVYMYVLDNSFFCVKSYNHQRGELTECLKCVGGNFENGINCNIFPINYTREENLRFLNALLTNKKKIHFLVQNVNQENLIKQHFGNVKTTIVGLYTDDMIIKESHHNDNNYLYDIVYHNASLEAKGLHYMLQIAKLLSNKRILMPMGKEKVCNTCKRYDIDIDALTNVTFKEMTWETGLMQAVERCKLVICPSLWSAPIEGAFIKSLMYNGCVAVVNTKYGFSNELYDLCINLNDNLNESKNIIEAYLENKKDREKKIQLSKTWIDNYIKNKEKMMNKLFTIFEE